MGLHVRCLTPKQEKILDNMRMIARGDLDLMRRAMFHGRINGMVDFDEVARYIVKENIKKDIRAGKKFNQ